MSWWMWALWGLFLIIQSYSFTAISRARNSGSLWRHIKAGLLSNGVWFIGQLFAVGVFMNILSGKLGVAAAIGACVFYTAFTLTGSVYAHHWALRTEKGQSAVGANKKFAQITVEEWAAMQEAMALSAKVSQQLVDRDVQAKASLLAEASSSFQC